MLVLVLYLYHKSVKNITDEPPDTNKYLDMVKHLEKYEMKKEKEYNKIINFLNKAEFVLDRNLFAMKVKFLKQRRLLMAEEAEQNYIKKQQKLIPLIPQTIPAQIPQTIQQTVPIVVTYNQGGIHQGGGGGGGGIYHDYRNYDLEDETHAVLANIINPTAPLEVIDRQNVHDSSINDKVKKDYLRIRQHSYYFKEGEIEQDIKNNYIKEKQYKVIETIELIRKRNDIVCQMDSEYEVIKNTYCKLKSIKADTNILYDNIYNCNREYLVCPSGVVANVVSSLAFLLDDVGILKTVPVIRHEIFGKVSVLKDPTKKEIENIVKEYKNDLRQSDYDLVMQECFIGAGLD